MVVSHDVRHDSRALKMSLALKDAGLEVTILGLSTTGRREESVLGGVSIIRIPVADSVRTAVATRQRRRRRHRLTVALDEDQRDALEQRTTLRARDREFQDDVGTKVRATGVGIDQGLARARAEADRRLRTAERVGWRTVDAAVSRVAVGASWRRVLPEIADYALALAPVIDSLDWDVLHAHDVHVVGVASHAVTRRRRSGRPANWIYDAHDYIAGLSLDESRSRRVRAAYLDLEREYARDAAAVLTVSEPLAVQLQRDLHLPARPTVVMNTPLGDALATGDPDLRRHLGLDAGTPLLVYAGGVSSARGIGTAVEALVGLPGVHLAVVAVPSAMTRAALDLAEQARGLGVGDRLHLVHAVAPERVSTFMASADVGLLPLLHFGSHEVALPDALWDYLHAGLPVLVSDCRAQADFVRRHGVGGVHAAGDVASFVREVQPLLKPGAKPSPDVVGELLAPLAWTHQTDRLREVYSAVLGAPLHTPTTLTRLSEIVERPAEAPSVPSVLAIGPANMAGQAWEWARATERLLPGLRAEVLSVDRGSAVSFAADEVVAASVFARDRAWAERRQEQAVATWTHALLEAGRPLFGLLNGRDFTGDVGVLRAAGVEVGLVLHGSEIRNPAAHAARSRWSPFTDPNDALTRRLQKQWTRLHPRVAAFDGPVFVSTPDLLFDVPQAHLLPVVVDVRRWASDQPVLEREVPVVVHAPSRAALKGSAHVESALAPLVAAGLIDYVRLEAVPPEQVFEIVRNADVVLDQFAIGSYGVLATEAMAAGRVVVAHVPHEVRQVHEVEPPIVEASPQDLEDVVRAILADPEAAREQARLGVAYAKEFHDGRRSAAILRDVLGLRGS